MLDILKSNKGKAVLAAAAAVLVAVDAFTDNAIVTFLLEVVSKLSA